MHDKHTTNLATLARLQALRLMRVHGLTEAQAIAIAALFWGAGQ